MGIKATFSKDDIKKALLLRLKRLDAAIISRFIFVGETFVKNARANHTYKDQTGNLTSSICYIVFKDGIQRSLGIIPEASRKLIEELRTKHLSGYVLIVATGMNYAAAVENMGKDVLTASSIKAKKDLQRSLKNFKLAA